MVVLPVKELLSALMVSVPEFVFVRLAVPMIAPLPAMV